MVVKSIAAAGVLAAVAGGAVLAQAGEGPPARAAQSRGGLAISPLKVERAAAAGAVDAMVVTNNSTQPLAIEVRARPWTQSASGLTSPNRRRTLGVGVSEASFTLARGASRQVTVTLRDVPSSGYLYGAVEVIGLPTDLDERKGVVAGYRLLAPLRYHATAPASSIRAGAVRVVGKGDDRALTLSVRNTGNTLEPVSGTVRLKSAFGIRNGSIKATRILPGKSVRLPLLSGAAVRPGRYTASITLTQARNRTTVAKKVTVRR